MDTALRRDAATEYGMRHLGRLASGRDGKPVGMVRPDGACGFSLHPAGNSMGKERPSACTGRCGARRTASAGRGGSDMGAAASVRIYDVGTFAICADRVFFQSGTLLGISGNGVASVPARVSHG